VLQARSKLEEERDLLQRQVARGDKEVRALKEAVQEAQKAKGGGGDAELREALRMSEARVAELQADAEFFSADLEVKSLEAKEMAGKLAQKDLELASLRRTLRASGSGASWLFACAAGEREAAMNVLEFSRLEMFVADTAQWAVQGAQAARQSLLELLRERGGGAGGTLPQLPEPEAPEFWALVEEALVAALQDGALLLVVPARAPAAESAERWTEALRAFVSAVGSCLPAAGNVSLLIEEPNVAKVLAADVFEHGIPASAAFAVRALRGGHARQESFDSL
jgi:hypothetical protein